MTWWRDGRFPKSAPRPAKGGIKLQSHRGGESWWAKRWIAVLESFDLGGRLSRGRSYARGGQVLSIDVEKGRVRAAVQGSNPRPYSVDIKVKALSAADWTKSAKAICGQAVFAAKLLAGEMPPDIEAVFREAGLSLFPERLGDLETGCSCPDSSNPCKHIAAVYYLLGEEFDRDPFLLFKMRGLAREELLSMLDKAGVAGGNAPVEAAPVAAEPLSSDAGVFWNGAPISEDLPGEFRVPSAPGVLSRRLGNFPFWRADDSLQDFLEPIYIDASARSLNLLLGSAQRDEDGPA
jgi:uncharacterized Zn finger protein